MNELLKALYDSFYEKLPATQLKAEIERCHQELIEKLDKPERKLVLQIIDCKDQLTEDLSIDSFIAGFRLAWKLSQELNTYERAQEIVAKRTQKHSDVPLNSKGKSLMAGLVYCGHCGSKLVLTTTGNGMRNGKKRIPSLRYNCHYQVRHRHDRDGMSGYSVTKVDRVMEQMVISLFKDIKSIPEQELVDNAESAAKEVKEEYNKILTWADMFEGSTLEGKKMIMWQVVEKVRIYRDYKFEVDLKPTIREFKELWRKRNTSPNNGAA